MLRQKLRYIYYLLQIKVLIMGMWGVVMINLTGTKPDLASRALNVHKYLSLDTV